MSSNLLPFALFSGLPDLNLPITLSNTSHLRSCRIPFCRICLEYLTPLFLSFDPDKSYKLLKDVFTHVNPHIKRTVPDGIQLWIHLFILYENMVGESGLTPVLNEVCKKIKRLEG